MYFFSRRSVRKAIWKATRQAEKDSPNPPAWVNVLIGLLIIGAILFMLWKM